MKYEAVTLYLKKQYVLKIAVKFCGDTTITDYNKIRKNKNDNVTKYLEVPNELLNKK